MSSGSLPRREFYREAVACIDTWRSRDPAGGGEVEPELRRRIVQVETAALGLLYGTPDPGTSERPLSAPESDAVLEVLRRLDSVPS